MLAPLACREPSTRHAALGATEVRSGLSSPLLGARFSPVHCVCTTVVDVARSMSVGIRLEGAVEYAATCAVLRAPVPAPYAVCSGRTSNVKRPPRPPEHAAATRLLPRFGVLPSRTQQSDRSVLLVPSSPLIRIAEKETMICDTCDLSAIRETPREHSQCWHGHANRNSPAVSSPSRRAAAAMSGPGCEPGIRGSTIGGVEKMGRG